MDKEQMREKLVDIISKHCDLNRAKYNKCHKRYPIYIMGSGEAADAILEAGFVHRSSVENEREVRLKEFVKRQKQLDPEISKLLDENFMELI